MYSTDNAGNMNASEVFSLVITKVSGDCWSDLGGGLIYVPTGCLYYIDSEVYIS